MARPKKGPEELLKALQANKAKLEAQMQNALGANAAKRRKVAVELGKEAMGMGIETVPEARAMSEAAVAAGGAEALLRAVRVMGSE